MKQQNPKSFIIAPSGSGKSTATKEHPEKFADIDWNYFSGVYENNKLVPGQRSPDFPMNYATAIAEAFKTHSVVIAPTGDIPVDLVKLLHGKKPETDQEVKQYINDVKDYVFKVTSSSAWRCGEVARDEQTGEIIPTAEFNKDVEQRTHKLIPILKELRGIKFQSVLMMPDADRCGEMVNSLIERSKKPEMKAKFAERVEGTQILNNQAFETGLFAKLPMHKGQYFLDAFENNQIQEPKTIEVKAINQKE